MKLLSFCLLAAISLAFSSCKKQDEPQEVFIFARYACFCHGNCITAYRLADGQLFRGTANCNPEDLVFDSTPLSSEKVALATELLNELPSQFCSSCEETFGCPDCADQGGYYLYLNKNGTIGKWRLDTQIDTLPENLKAYALKVQETVQELE